MRFSFYDLLIYALLFVFVIAFPVDLIPVSFLYQQVIRIGLRLLLLIYFAYIIYKNRIKIFGIANKLNLLFCVPFVAVAFSNLIAASIDGGFIPNTYSDSLFAVNIVSTFIQVIIEEIVFRLFIHNSLVNTSSIKRIFGGAAIFALCHLLNIINVRTLDALVTVLVQVVYTFGLGILLGFLYEYSHSLLGAIGLHFAFNFFNTVLYENLGGHASTLAFYITAVVIGVVVGIYTFLIYQFKFRKFERYYRS